MPLLQAGVCKIPHEQELARQIVTMLEDKDLYRCLSDAGLTRAKQFTFDNFERSVNSVLEMCE
jgi:hypothetical protein